MDLIIGAGVSGISYATFTNNDYCMVEATNEIGGYCKTIKKGEFVWDYSGHFFHFRDEKLKELICKYIDPQTLKKVNKNTKSLSRLAFNRVCRLIHNEHISSKPQ